MQIQKYFIFKSHENAKIMDMHRLNRLIQKVLMIKSHVSMYENDPLLTESLEDYLKEIKLQYGSFLLEKLFDVYDDFFSDSKMKSVEEYLTQNGVEVEGDDFDESHSRLAIRAFPLRIEVTGATNTFKEIIWQAA